ncbi:LamG-like jellyroll fold domain-containing protein [Tichowtungia aerotolerans]|uniref:LamG domain-containing protein n=1 Tax=Tichowtungia aerotolerans TaxID=2697043 RepID=A0A6P1M7L8_9BACT|nr:LamG-like jellyroll fold domain-containing protein [Tichowtungia aerotolerans]QHI69043.1 hypothetical protein GT409_06155 [Tichowtungia aerotolerans]
MMMCVQKSIWAAAMLSGAGVLAEPLLVSHFDSVTDADYSVGNYVTVQAGAIQWPLVTSIDPKFGDGCLDLTGGTALQYHLRDNFNLGKGTIELWVNPQAADAGSDNYLFSIIKNGANRIYLRRSVSQDGSQQQLYLYLAVNGISKTLVSGYQDVSRFLSVGSWHHIAMTWDLTKAAGADEVSLYADGENLVADRTLTFGEEWGEEPSRLSIGCYSAVAKSYASAYIDELRISDDIVYEGSSYAVPSSPFEVPGN